MHFNLSLSLASRVIAPGSSGGVTKLTREANGTVTVISLARTWVPNLTREANGTVTVR